MKRRRLMPVPHGEEPAEPPEPVSTTLDGPTALVGWGITHRGVVIPPQIRSNAQSRSNAYTRSTPRVSNDPIAYQSGISGPECSSLFVQSALSRSSISSQQELSRTKRRTLPLSLFLPKRDGCLMIHTLPLVQLSFSKGQDLEYWTGGRQAC